MDLLWIGVLLLCVFSVLAEECGLCNCRLSANSVGLGGVRTINTQCQEGHVQWRLPQGALRMHLKAPFSGEFKLCFVVESKFMQVIISRENLTQSFNRRRRRKRRVINDAELEELVIAHGRTNEVCLTSVEPVVLYIEPVPDNSATSGIGMFTLQYDIERSSSRSLLYSPFEECRPCSEEEIIRSFCSSDFVVVGTMADVEHTEDHSTVVVEAAQIVRQRGSHFHRTRRESATLRGKLLAPRHCGIAAGHGTFLFTGRVRLGQLKLRCAPYYNDWMKLVLKAKEEGRMECEVE